MKEKINELKFNFINKSLKIIFLMRYQLYKN